MGFFYLIQNAGSHSYNYANNYIAEPIKNGYQSGKEKITSIFLKIKYIISNPGEYKHRYIQIPLKDSKNCMTALIKNVMTINTLYRIGSNTFRFIICGIAYYCFPNTSYMAFFAGIAFSEKMRETVDKVSAIVKKIKKQPWYKIAVYSTFLIPFYKATKISRAVSAHMASFYISAELGMQLVEFFLPKEDPKRKLKKPLTIDTTLPFRRY